MPRTRILPIKVADWYGSSRGLYRRPYDTTDKETRRSRNILAGHEGIVPPERSDSDDGVTDRQFIDFSSQTDSSQITGIIERMDSNDRRVRSLYNGLRLANVGVRDLMQIQERLTRTQERLEEKIRDIERREVVKMEEGKTRGMGVESGMTYNWYEGLMAKHVDKKTHTQERLDKKDARYKRDLKRSAKMEEGKTQGV